MFLSQTSRTQCALFLITPHPPTTTITPFLVQNLDLSVFNDCRQFAVVKEENAQLRQQCAQLRQIIEGSVSMKVLAVYFDQYCSCFNNYTTTITFEMFSSIQQIRTTDAI